MDTFAKNPVILMIAPNANRLFSLKQFAFAKNVPKIFKSLVIQIQNKFVTSAKLDATNV